MNFYFGTFEYDLNNQIIEWYKEQLKQGRWEWSETDHSRHIQEVLNDPVLFRKVADDYWREYFREK